MATPAEIRDRVLKTHAVLLEERASYDAHWRDIADFMAPRRGRWHATDRARGTKRSDKAINDTAAYAVDTLEAGMTTGMTSPSRPWFSLSVADPELNEQPLVREWLYGTTQRMRDVIAGSGLYGVLPTIYGDTGCFGTAALILDEDDETVVRPTVFPVGSFALGQNAKGVIDTLVREFSMTARQLVDRFGRDAVSRPVLEASNDPARAHRYLSVVHFVGPNPDHVPGAKDGARKPWLAVYMEKSGGDPGKVLEVGGYDSKPLMAPRWTTKGDDVYAPTCPGMRSLADTRALQAIERRKLGLIDKLTDPPMRAAPELRGQYTSLVPGDITYVSGQAGGAGFEPIYVPDPRGIQFAAAEIAQHEARIERAFYVDVFRMLSQSRVQTKTAREVDELHEEKMLMLGTVVERMESDLLKPLIDRVFDVMWRRGMIDEPPDVLQGMDVTPQFTSILAQAQRAVGAQGIERAATFTVSLAQSNPDVLDKFDFDQAVDEYTTAIGSPPTIIRSDAKVAQLREARQQAQQMAAMAQQAAAAKDAAQAAKTASETAIGSGSALDALIASQAPAQAAA